MNGIRNWAAAAMVLPMLACSSSESVTPDADPSSEPDAPEAGASAGTEFTDNQDVDHSAVTEVYVAYDVIFHWNAGGLLTGELDFGEDIVSVGTDARGEVVHFKCPEGVEQFHGGNVNFEVHIPKVAGTIDATGQVIRVEGAAFEFWGEVGGVTLTEEDALMVPIFDAADPSSSVLTLSRVQPAPAHALYSFDVNAVVGAVSGLTLKQSALFTLIDVAKPGLLSKGTQLSWAINLESPSAP